jgi:hypothetical protein
MAVCLSLGFLGLGFREIFGSYHYRPLLKRVKRIFPQSGRFLRPQLRDNDMRVENQNIAVFSIWTGLHRNKAQLLKDIEFPSPGLNPALAAESRVEG